MEENKISIALGYYKKILTERVIKLNNLECVGRDRFLSHINHTDLNRMHKKKLINKTEYEELFKLLSE